MSVRLNDTQRRLFAERATELGNFAVTALLIGQVIAGQFRLDWTVLGVVLAIATYGAGAILSKGVSDNG